MRNKIFSSRNRQFILFLYKGKSSFHRVFLPLINQQFDLRSLTISCISQNMPNFIRFLHQLKQAYFYHSMY